MKKTNYQTSLILGARMTKANILTNSLLIGPFVLLLCFAFSGGQPVLFVILVLGVLLWTVLRIRPRSYIEFVQENMYVCHESLQSGCSMFLAMLKNREREVSRKYPWEDLKTVKITMGNDVYSVHSRLGGYYHSYLLGYTFVFNDASYEFKGICYHQQIKDIYRLLKEHQIDIQTTEQIAGFFEQDELSQFDYFENIYHRNYPRKKKS